MFPRVSRFVDSFYTGRRGAGSGQPRESPNRKREGKRGSEREGELPPLRLAAAMASASRKGLQKIAAAAGLTPVAGDADLTSCPNCYLYFDYSIKGNSNLVPRLLPCGHLVCST